MFSRLIVLNPVLMSFLFVFIFGCWGVGVADENAADSKEPARGNKTNLEASEKNSSKKAPSARERRNISETAIAPRENISPEREAVDIEFAQQNHPELALLLQNLKTSSPKDYQAALADLDRTVERLAKSKDKTPEKYETQLADWKNASRIRLSTARLTVSEDAATESQLRSALGERLKLRLAAQIANRERLRKRLERLDQSIEEMSSNSDAMIDKQFADLRKKFPASKTIPKSRTKKSTTSGSLDESVEKK